MSCIWTYDESHKKWDTQCGTAHQFTNDGPKENKHKWCPYCGEPLVDVVPPDEIEEEGDVP